MLLLINIGMQLETPVLIGRFIDAAVNGRSLDQLLYLALVFAGLTVATNVISMADNYLAQNVAWSVTNAIRKDLTMHCLRMGPSFFKNYTAGVLVERIDGDVAQLANFLSRFAVSILGSIFLMIGIVISIARINWCLGLILFIFAVLGLLSFNPVRRLIVGKARQLRQVQSEWTGLIEEVVNGREDIRTCRAEEYVHRLLHNIHKQLLIAFRANALVNTLGWSVGAVLFGLAHILIIVGGVWLFHERHASIGTVYLLFNYTLRFLDPLFGIARQVQDVQQSIGSSDRILDIFNMFPDISDGQGVPVPLGPLQVDFENVSFGYDAGCPVLRDLSFTLPAGRTLAVVGPTGSGKSTLARLLFRLYNRQSGAIKLSGVDIQDAKLDDLRSKITLVTQDVQLFRGTLRDNITLFAEDVGDARLLDAITGLGLSEWFQTLPCGFDTYLNGQDSLSAGEGQLVSLLRVYLKQPGLVILDEASARLDPITAIRVQSALEKLLEGRTVIIIAHRMDATRNADMVLVLQNGMVQELGDRDSLLGHTHSYYSSKMCQVPRRLA